MFHSARSASHESYLPQMHGIADGLRQGRNVYQGYQRGWGLQFGGLREKVLADPLNPANAAVPVGTSFTALKARAAGQRDRPADGVDSGRGVADQRDAVRREAVVHELLGGQRP